MNKKINRYKQDYTTDWDNPDFEKLKEKYYPSSDPKKEGLSKPNHMYGVPIEVLRFFIPHYKQCRPEDFIYCPGYKPYENDYYNVDGTVRIIRDHMRYSFYVENICSKKMRHKRRNISAFNKILYKNFKSIKKQFTMFHRPNMLNLSYDWDSFQKDIMVLVNQILTSYEWHGHGAFESFVSIWRFKKRYSKSYTSTKSVEENFRNIEEDLADLDEDSTENINEPNHLDGQNNKNNRKTNNDNTLKQNHRKSRGTSVQGRKNKINRGSKGKHNSINIPKDRKTNIMSQINKFIFNKKDIKIKCEESSSSNYEEGNSSSNEENNISTDKNISILNENINISN